MLLLMKFRYVKILSRAFHKHGCFGSYQIRTTMATVLKIRGMEFLYIVHKPFHCHLQDSATILFNS